MLWGVSVGGQSLPLIWLTAPTPRGLQEAWPCMHGHVLWGLVLGVTHTRTLREGIP